MCTFKFRIILLAFTKKVKISLLWEVLKKTRIAYHDARITYQDKRASGKGEKAFEVQNRFIRISAYIYMPNQL